MNLLDLAIVATAVLAAIGGYQAGLVTRILSWAGLALGIVLAAWALPSVVQLLSEDNPRGRFVLATALLLGFAFIGQAVGLVLGARANLALPSSGRRFDHVAGGFAGLFGVLVALWLLVPALVQVPGEMSHQALQSRIARFVVTVGPPAPPALQTLSRLIDATGIPEVFDDPRSAPDAGVPPAESGMSQAVLDAAVASTVRVESEACGRIQEGSGFAVEDGLIVTNAHVVAGARAPNVVTRSGRRVPATLVQFDPDRDLALLRADTRLSPLPLGRAEVGDRGAVLGYPGGGGLVVSPFEVFRDIHPSGRDLYDSHRTERHVLILAAALRPGDSGAAVVDTGGQVVGVAFAIAPDNPNTAYALDRSELDAVLAAPRGEAVGSGRCLS